MFAESTFLLKEFFDRLGHQPGIALAEKDILAHQPQGRQRSLAVKIAGFHFGIHVKRLLLKHFAVQEGVTVEAMVEEVRSEFGDEGLIVGEDLMTIDV